MKICPKCNIEKSLNEFYNDKTSSDKKSWQCKTCQNIAQKNYLKSIKTDTDKAPSFIKKRNKYDLTPIVYNDILISQKGLCSICGKVCKSGNRLAVDHNHKTGTYRGLLCVKCNTGLGQFNDNPDLLENAIKYLNTSNMPMKNKSQVLKRLEDIRQRVRQINYLINTNGSFDDFDKAFQEFYETVEDTESLINSEEDAFPFKTNQLI